MNPRTVAAGNVTLELQVAGSGPPLLFLHGEDGLLWSDAILDAFAQNFTVTAALHPGWGASGCPPWLTETHDIARLYAEVLDSIDDPDGAGVCVVGCSFGGWVAAELATLRPAKLGSLVLVAPTGIKVGGREERDFVDIWTIAQQDLPAVWYAGASAGPDLAGLNDEQYLELAQAHEATARFCWKPYMHSQTLPNWLRLVDVPALVVSGEHDHFCLQPDYHKVYASRIGLAGADLARVPGAGHRVEQDAPAELARLVAEFASRARVNTEPGE